MKITKVINNQPFTVMRRYATKKGVFKITLLYDERWNTYCIEETEHGQTTSFISGISTAHEANNNVMERIKRCETINNITLTETPII